MLTFPGHLRWISGFCYDGWFRNAIIRDECTHACLSIALVGAALSTESTAKGFPCQASPELGQRGVAAYHRMDGSESEWWTAGGLPPLLKRYEFSFRCTDLPADG